MCASQVTIERVHIRYEDQLTTPGHPFACGVMLTSLAAETTDASWRATQVDGSATVMHKVSRAPSCTRSVAHRHAQGQSRIVMHKVSRTLTVLNFSMRTLVIYVS